MPEGVKSSTFGHVVYKERSSRNVSESDSDGEENTRLFLQRNLETDPDTGEDIEIDIPQYREFLYSLLFLFCHFLHLAIHL